MECFGPIRCIVLDFRSGHPKIVVDHVSKLVRKTEEVGHVVGDLIRHGVRLLDTATEEFFVVGD